VVSTEHEHLHHCVCGELVARFCRHKDTTAHDGSGFEHLSLGDEPMTSCDRCGDVFWSHHRHKLLDDHGDPHIVYCEDCGVEIGARQLLPGIPISKSHGHICGDCLEGRRQDEERREAEDQPSTPA
jgi:hypothetical protein